MKFSPLALTACAIAGVYIAYKAKNQWFYTLKNKRHDELNIAWFTFFSIYQEIIFANQGGGIQTNGRYALTPIEIARLRSAFFDLNAKYFNAQLSFNALRGEKIAVIGEYLYKLWAIPLIVSPAVSVFSGPINFKQLTDEIDERIKDFDLNVRQAMVNNKKLSLR